MTVVDQSHPKAQMALTTEGQSTNGSDTDALPSYTPSASGSTATQPLFSEQGDARMINFNTATLSSPSRNPGQNSSFSPFTIESVNDLNPEMRKKLANDMHSRDPFDFGFQQPVTDATLPAFPTGANTTPTGGRPEYQIDRDGNITSHDPKLNSNAAALLQFLRLHAASPPSFSVHIRGSHVETREVTTWEVGKHGRRRERRETRRDEVEDFEFHISTSQVVEAGLGTVRSIGSGGSARGVLYPVGGWESVHRGGAWRTRERTPEEADKAEKGRTGAIRLAEESEIGLDLKRRIHDERWRRVGCLARRKLNQAMREREKRGLPLFINPSNLVDVEDDPRPATERQEFPAQLFKSHWVDLVETHASVPLAMTAVGRTPLPATFDVLVEERERREEEVRNIVEQYCACDSQLKELLIEKQVYGWRLDHLEAGIRSIIQRSYSGTVQIAFRTSPSHIVIRPDNWVSRVFSLAWYWKLLLWLLLVYPVLLIVEFFAGKRWYNLRVAFPLTRWKRLPAVRPGSFAFGRAIVDDRVDGSVDAHLQSGSSGSNGMTYAEALALATELSSSAAVKVAQFPVVEPNDITVESNLSASSSSSSSRPPTQNTGPWVYLVGQQEGEWLRQQETRIVEAVNRGVRGQALDVAVPLLDSRAESGFVEQLQDRTNRTAANSWPPRDPVEMLRGYHK